MRYLKNNFFDGARQDAFDLVTGVWTPEHGAAGFLISDDRPLIIRAVSECPVSGVIPPMVNAALGPLHFLVLSLYGCCRIDPSEIVQ